MTGHENRPSIHELDKKIAKSKDLVTKGKILVINTGAIASDASELGYSATDLQTVLLKVLREVKPEYYIGRRPPEKAYEPQISGKDLFAFRWMCREFGCETYFKFCLKGRCFYLVSLHQDRSIRTL